MKADIQGMATPESFFNGCFAPGSGHSGNIAVNDRFPPGSGHSANIDQWVR